MTPHDSVLMQCSGLCESCRLWFVTPTSSARLPMSHRYASFPVRAGPLRMPVLQSRATCADPCGLFAVWPDSWPCSLVPVSASADSRRQKALGFLPSVVATRPDLTGNDRSQRAHALPMLRPKARPLCITIIGRSRHLVRGPGANGAMVGMCTEKRHPYDWKASHFTGLPASGENQSRLFCSESFGLCAS